MTLNIFEVINNNISDFVENQENKALKRGTGSYSIPFRGSIFGEIETAKVLSKLNAESVDVIWLGSNPNVPESLDAILSPSSQGESMNVQISFNATKPAANTFSK